MPLGIEELIRSFNKKSKEYLEEKEKIISFIIRNKNLIYQLSDPFLMDLLGGPEKYLRMSDPQIVCKYASTIVEIKKRGGKPLGNSKSLLQSPRRKRISDKEKRI